MDEKAKRTLLRKVPGALYVVGIRRAKVEDPAEDVRAFVASWFTQSSFDPPLVALGVKRGTRSHAWIEESRVLCINFLAADQKALAQAFFRELPVTATTMGETDYRSGATGTPILSSAMGFLDCEVVAIHADQGDHDLVVARVVEAGVRQPDSDPLTYANTGWHYGG